MAEENWYLVRVYENSDAGSQAAIRFAAAVARHTGIHILPADIDRVWRRVCTHARHETGALPARLLEELEGPTADSKLRTLILDLVVNAETYFFRDRGVFELLRSQIGPELIERRAEARSLRIWSAGCSTGEEPYSLAATFRDVMPTGWTLRVTATDISLSALDRARQGIYREWSLRGLAAAGSGLERLPAGGWRVPNAWRVGLHFREANILAEPLDECLNSDLVVCRNVLIYFAEETRQAVLSRLAGAVAPGGFLIIGHAECLGSRPEGFDSRIFPEAVVWQRRSAAEDLLPSHTSLSAPRSRDCRPNRRSAARLSRPAAASEPPSTAPPIGPNCSLAQELADGGEYEAALALCDDILRESPFETAPRMLQARIHLAMGQPAQSRDVLLGVLYLDNSVVAAYVELIHVAALLGDGTRRSWAAARARELLASTDPDSPVPHLTGRRAGLLLRQLQDETDGTA